MARAKVPASFALMQQPHCLAVSYLKSMLSAGLATIACCDYNLKNVATGNEHMRILCIGHGGGSLPLFLAGKIQGAMVDIVEIDTVVISTSESSVQAIYGVSSLFSYDSVKNWVQGGQRRRRRRKRETPAREEEAEKEGD